MLTGTTALFVTLGLALLFTVALSRMDDNGNRRSSLFPLPIVGLLVVTLLMRFNRLDEGIWLDEIGSWVRFGHMPLSRIPFAYDSENQHFLYSILARISLMVFGDSVWAFRLPAVLFGVAAVWAMFLFGREVAGTRQGFAAALLLAFSYHHLWFSQNARGYSGMLFWALLSSYFLIRAMRERSIKLWLWYAFSAALGGYTQATMVFLLVTQGVAGIVYAIRKSEWRGPLIGLGLGAVLSAALHIPAFPVIIPSLRGTTSVVEEWKQPIWTIREIIAGLSAQFGGGLVFAAGVVGLMAAIVIFAGLLSFVRKMPMVPILLIVPALLGTAVFVGTGHHVWPRFYFFGFGFGALILVRGIVEFCNWLMRFAKRPDWGPGFAAFMLMLTVLASAASMQRAYGPKQDFASPIHEIRERGLPGDAIVTVSLTSYVYRRFYNMNYQHVEHPVKLEQIMAGAPRTWLIYTLEPVVRSENPRLYKIIMERFKTVTTYRGTLHSGDVVVCLYVRDSDGRK